MSMPGGALMGAPIMAAPIMGAVAGAGASYAIALDHLATGDITYLLEINAFPLDLAGTRRLAGIGAGPIMGSPLPVWSSTLNYAPAERRLFYSDTGYFSQPTDTRRCQLWRGRLSSLTIERTVALSPESYNDGRVSLSATLSAGDGGLDDVVASNAIDGRDIAVLVGPRSVTASRDSDFSPLFGGSAVTWQSDGSADGNSSVSIQAEDRTYRLDEPLQLAQYDGTGGIGGTTEIKGQSRPTAFGRRRNITPVLIDQGNNIYQVHDRRIQAVDAVTDRGEEYVNDGDLASYAALVAWTPVVGHYVTCLAIGCFRIGSTPAGAITCDVKGDADTALGGYVDTIPGIVRRILLQRAAWTAAEVEFGSFDRLEYDLPGEAGYYLAPEGATTDANWSAAPRTKMRDVIAYLLKGVAAYPYVGRDSRYRVDRLREPDAAAVVATLTSGDILSLREMPLPDAIYPPTWRRRVGYAKSETVQTTDLAATMSDDRRAFVQKPWRIATADDNTVRIRFLRSKDPDPIESNLENEADAQDLADYLMSLWSVPRQLLEVVVRPAPGHLIEYGDTVRLFWPRLGLGAGRIVRAFPVREDLDRSVTLVCWS